MTLLARRRLLREGLPRRLDPACGHGDLAEPSAGVSAYQTSTVTITVSKTTSRRRAASGRRAAPRETNGSPSTRNRQAMVEPTRIPTRGPATTIGSHGRSLRDPTSLPSHEILPVARPVDAERLTKLAGPSRVRGPFAPARRRASRRARRSARPARSRTAHPLSDPPDTAFMQKCMP